MAEVTTCLLWSLCFILGASGQQKLLRVQKTEELKGHCSTWGNYHFRTFDGTSFTFPGKCEYMFASNCHSSLPDFDIKIQRVLGEEWNRVYFRAIIDSVIIDISEEGITVDGDEISLPYTKRSVVVDDTCENFKITSRIGVTLTWNWGDDLKLELDDMYNNKTCGLCGDFDGIPTNDINWKGYKVSPILFGNVHRINGPKDDCPDVADVQKDKVLKDECEQQMRECENHLSSMGNCKDKLSSYQDYVNTCKGDLCSCASNNKTVCICSTLNQFSKECVLAGGHPGSWRSPDLCFMNCPNTMEFFECVSPCPDSCSNPAASSLCNEHCTEGCSCPPGTLLDDVHHRKECVKQSQCPCVHSGKIYKPGDSYSTACQQCTCILGQWACTQAPCSGNCSLRGGSHIRTYDDKEFTFHGNCQYVMSKDTNKRFAVIAKVVQCGMTESVTCLNAVHINIGKVTIKICYCGNVYINNFITLLPKIKDGIILHRPSSYFISVVTPFGLSVQVQVKPVFQLFITLNSTFQGQTTGLCGNFNGAEADDLKTLSGVVEESVSAFSNSWKVQASCSDVTDHFENPCSRSISRDEYAKHWCTLLINTTEIFSECHPYLDPIAYLKYCMYDVCNSDHSEDSLCMWLSMYARDCALKGGPMLQWRGNICDPSESCPETMEFTYNPRPCNFSCRSLSEPDPLCNIPSTPNEGCSCPEGSYMTPNEKCVSPEECPCNYKGRDVPAGQSLKVDEILCKCIHGILECPTNNEPVEVCKPPMYYVHCNAGPDAVGAECQKSCKTQDMQCYSKECLPGCVCPSGLVSDDNGDCILPSQCPCVYGGKFYETGETIAVPCNTCTCKNRTWICTENPCPHICTVYGNGHYLTFDGSQFDFSGDCDYVLAQDFCPDNHREGSFRIIIENIACGENEAICSLYIKVIYKNITIKFFEGRVEESNRDNDKDISYKIDMVGLYIVLKTNHGLLLMWDQKTTVIVQLSSSFERIVCGLCGNFDGRSNNDFISSWHSLEGNENVFADSWKVRQGCNSGVRPEPCLENPAKLPWAQKQCSLIKSNVFASCHPKVDPIPFYDSCVSDSCSCTEGGDCECLCTSLAAYSAACRRNDVCIAWRTPDICPLFCDYYNKDGHCEWHYKPCGVPCILTCTNPMGKCDNQSQLLEGCYPVCSKHRPYFDEETKHCVPVLNCTICDPDKKLCDEDTAECLCCYNRTTYQYLQEITTIFEGRPCVIGYCGPNGDIFYSTNKCGITPTVPTSTGPSYAERTTPGGLVLTPRSFPTTTLTKKTIPPSRYSRFNRTTSPKPLPSLSYSPYTRQYPTLEVFLPTTKVLSSTMLSPETKLTEKTFFTMPVTHSTSESAQTTPSYAQTFTTLKTSMATVTRKETYFPTQTYSEKIFTRYSPYTRQYPTLEVYFPTTKALSSTTLSPETKLTEKTFFTMPVTHSTSESAQTTLSYAQTFNTSMATVTRKETYFPTQTYSDKILTSYSPYTRQYPSKALSTTTLSPETKLTEKTFFTMPVTHSTRESASTATTPSYAQTFNTSMATVTRKETYFPTQTYSDKIPTSTLYTQKTTPKALASTSGSVPTTSPVKGTLSLSGFSRIVKTTHRTIPHLSSFGYSPYTNRTTISTKSKDIYSTLPLKTKRTTFTKATIQSSSGTAQTTTSYSQIVNASKTPMTTVQKISFFPTPREAEKTFKPTSVSQTTEMPRGDCLVLTKDEHISLGSCKTVEKVSINYCAGHCATSAWYVHTSQTMSRNCSCCMETKKESRKISLQCSDGGTIDHTYVHVEKCSCVRMKCYEDKDVN